MAGPKWVQADNTLHSHGAWRNTNFSKRPSRLYHRRARARLIELANSSKPARAILRNKRIIREIRVFAANPVDLATLPWTEPFIGVQTPNAFHQSLATKNLVTARNTAAKPVGDIKKRRIAIRDPRIECKQIIRQRPA